MFPSLPEIRQRLTPFLRHLGVYLRGCRCNVFDCQVCFWNCRFTFNSGSKWKDLQGDLPIYTPNKIDEKRISMGGISNLTSVGTSDIGSTIPSRNSTLTLKSFSNSLKPPVITPNDSAYSLTPSEHQPLSLTPSISDSFLDLSSETRNGNDCRL